MMLPLTLLTLLPAALALPPRSRQPALCSGFGEGAYPTAYGFTLSAYNISDETIPLSDTGLPLTIGPLGGTATLSSGVLATQASVEAAQGTTPFSGVFNMSAGALIPLGGDAYTADLETADGQLAWWYSPIDNGQVGSPAEIYCNLANTDPFGGGNPYPILAMNGETDKFYLCESKEGYNQVVQNPVSGSSSYLYETCYSVTVHLIS